MGRHDHNPHLRWDRVTIFGAIAAFWCVASLFALKLLHH